jgi:anaerobic selenocysteine-containing dehydrogenase
MSSVDPYTYNIVMNMETAKKKGIKDGDTIYVEAPWGYKVPGRVKLVQAIHPQVMAIVRLGGWAKGRPIARGKGINFNALLKGDHKHICPIVGSIEESCRVKAYKAEVAK